MSKLIFGLSLSERRAAARCALEILAGETPQFLGKSGRIRALAMRMACAVERGQAGVFGAVL